MDISVTVALRMRGLEALLKFALLSWCCLTLLVVAISFVVVDSNICGRVNQTEEMKRSCITVQMTFGSACYC